MSDRLLDQSGASDEAELLARSRLNDPEAFGILVERYASVIINVTYRMVGERADAEDLAQDTFLAAFKSLPTFRADARFSTWLYRIAVNKCKDWLRSRRGSHEPVEERNDEPAGAEPAEHRTPEQVLSQQEVAEHLEEAIQRLPPVYREAFVLRHVEGVSYEEMEEMLGVKTDTLKMRVYKGRVQLSRELAKWK